MKEVKSTWNLKQFYENIDDPNIDKCINEARTKNYAFINRWNNRTDYLENPEILSEAIEEYEEIEHNYGITGNAGYYIGLSQLLNQGDPKLKAKEEKINEVAQEVENDIKFFEERIAKIPKDKQQLFLSNPDLAKYRHLLETMFRNSRYLLSEGEEKIVNVLSPTSFSSWVRMVSEFVSLESAKVKNETKSFSEILDLLDDKDKSTRDEAATKFNKILEKHTNSAEHEINAILKYKKELDKLRGFERPDAARHLVDDMETEVVDSLIDSIRASFDISREYYELKSKLMGVPKLEYHERNVQLGEENKKYNFEEAYKIVTKVLGSLDKDFYNIITDTVESERVDARPKEGKVSGAICIHNLKSQPIFILLNHTNRLEDVVTFAHESGHAIHFELTKRNQNSLNMDISLATAEVASTFIEDFVLEELYKGAQEENRLWMLMKKLNGQVSSIQRQCACYLFEQELHNEYRRLGYLTKEAIGKIFSRNMQAYMGDYVIDSEGSQNWWVYWSHVRSFFYVYSYASGELISMFMQRMVREDKKNIEKIKNFLSAGSSKSPAEIFLNLGIDIKQNTFWNEALKEQRETLDKAWNLAKKLGKL